MPDGLKDEESVSLILSYLTAYQMLYRSAKIQEGQTILVHACAGVVGTAMLHLGKLLSEKNNKPEIGKIMPLGEAAEAHRLVEEARIVGKIVLCVNDDK